jgi:CheY-like chemotaxis protein
MSYLFDQKFSALIITPDIKRRSRIKLAIHHDQLQGQNTFGTVNTANSLQEALAKLEVDQGYEILLITDSFKEYDIGNFIKKIAKIRTAKFGIVMVYHAMVQDEDNLVKGLLAGVDAVLIEPFSVDSLHEIAIIADRVRKENEECRLRWATSLSVDSLCEEVDRRAADLAAGRAQRPYPKKVKAVSNMLRGLTGPALEQFYENLVTTTARAAPVLRRSSTDAEPDEYTGPSEILRRKFQKQGAKIGQKQPPATKQSDSKVRGE